MQTQYLERPQGKLAYSDYGGEGEIVLMLPGMGALRSEYRYLVPDLSQAGYRPVTVDLRGHGESSVPWEQYDVPSVGSDILALIEHLHDSPVHLIGTSFAAGSVVWAAAEQPESVRSQVLIGAFVRDVKLNPIMNALFWLMVKFPWRVPAWVMYYRSLYPTRKPPDFDEYLSQLKENLSQPGRFDAAVAMAYSSRMPSEERLRKVKAPTLVIMGSKDPDFPDPAAEGKYIAEHTSGNLEMVTGAGHYPQTEMPEVTNPMMIDFLQKT